MRVWGNSLILLNCARVVGWNCSGTRQIGVILEIRKHCFSRAFLSVTLVSTNTFKEIVGGIERKREFQVKYFQPHYLSWTHTRHAFSTTIFEFHPVSRRSNSCTRTLYSALFHCLKVERRMISKLATKTCELCIQSRLNKSQTLILIPLDYARPHTCTPPPRQAVSAHFHIITYSRCKL